MKETKMQVTIIKKCPWGFKILFVISVIQKCVNDEID